MSERTSVKSAHFDVDNPVVVERVARATVDGYHDLHIIGLPADVTAAVKRWLADGHDVLGMRVVQLWGTLPDHSIASVRSSEQLWSG